MHTVSFAWARVVAACAVVGAALGLLPAAARAQGVTSGAISGVVSDQNGRPLEGAAIVVVNRATGFQTGAQTRANGRYFVQNLEVGRQYLVRVRLLGFAPQERANVGVTLGQTTRLDFTLTQAAQTLQAVAVQGERADAVFSPTKSGVSTTVTDTLIRRVPNLNRELNDLVRVVPQVAQPQDGGPSAGGAYNRFNNYTIDGVNQNDRFQLGSSEGVPGGATNGRQVSVEAVKEFQVLMAPTDVRQGNFGGGMLINAVTRNGTNTWTGGATYTFRNSDLARDTAFIRNSDFSVRNYSFSIGGPIIKDRLHFFVVPEFQERTQPASGPALRGTNWDGNVALDSINRIVELLTPRFNPGTVAPVSIGNPLRNLFGRIDFQVNENNRLVVRQLLNRAEIDEFSRNTAPFNTNLGSQNSGIRLTSNAFSRVNTNNSTAIQLFSNLGNGIANEFSFGWNTIRDVRSLPVNVPEISVRVTPIGGTSPTAAVTAGSERFSPSNRSEQDILEITNNLTVPLGANHTMTIGGRYEHTRIFNFFAQGVNGAWTFPSIAALAANQPDTYVVAYDNGGGIPARFRVNSFAGYIQDQWSVSPTMTLTYGLRADAYQFRDTPSFNPALSGRIPGLETDQVARTHVNWSPRVGLNWDVGGTRTTQVRLNAGVFSGPAPFIMISNGFSNTGNNLAQLQCPAAVVPAFTTDVDALPRSCAGQPAPVLGAAGTVGINTVARDFRMPQFATLSAGFDRRLPWDVTLTVEGMYREALSAPLIVDRNIIGPRLDAQGIVTDRNGRVLYADAITTGGNTGFSVTNNNQRYVLTTGTNRVGFSEGAIELQDQARDRNWNISTQLRKRFGSWLDLNASYTYMQSRDVQSLTSDRAISNWRNGRQLATAHTDLTPTTSYFQRPHRVTAFGTLTAPWRRFGQTDFTFFYEGMSGTPFTYTTNGDVNGDLFNGNDPIYVPRNAADLNEIRIGTGVGAAFVPNTEAAQAFESFIEQQPCLDRQRGSIMARNSCRSPWQNRMDVSIRQSLPRIAGQSFTVQLDIFNFLNFLNSEWGIIELPVLSANFPSQQVLQARGVTSNDLRTQQVNYEFNATVRNNCGTSDAANVVNGQPACPNAARPFGWGAGRASNLYQMQLTFRWAF